MKRVFVLVCTAAVLLVTGCGSDDADQEVKTDWSEAEIVEQMGLLASSDGAGWTFDAGGDHPGR